MQFPKVKVSHVAVGGIVGVPNSVLRREKALTLVSPAIKSQGKAAATFGRNAIPNAE
ncbi:MAG: hypothetical protein ACYDDS_18765 [Candidatus Sulfotelmatobacter sp.]